MVFYWALVAGWDVVAPDGETLAGVLLAPMEAREVPVIKGKPGLYEAALASATASREMPPN